MPAPTLRVFVDFDSDTAFEINPLILDSATEGILDTNTLGSGTLPVEITDLVTKVAIRRGRNRLTSQFEAGTANVTLYDQTAAKTIFYSQALLTHMTQDLDKATMS
jgi:hypothetical protein